MISDHIEPKTKILGGGLYPWPAPPREGEGKPRSKNGTQARGAWDLLDGIKLEGAYTISGKPDADLGDLRSLAMGRGEVPAGDPIQRLKSGSGWGTREPLIRRSKSKHFVVPRDRLSHCGEQKHVAPSCEPRMMTTSRLFVSRRSLQRRTLGTYPALPWNHDALFLLLRSTRTKFKSHIGSQYTSTVVGDYRLSPKGLHKLRCFRNTSGERPTRLQM